jgi:hypothetical protein
MQVSQRLPRYVGGNLSGCCVIFLEHRVRCDRQKAPG